MIERIHLPDDAVVMLDPAVEVLGAFDDHVLLCHGELEISMAVPPGDGLMDVVQSLTGEPVRVGDLRAEYDDSDLLDEILTSLASRNLARVTPAQLVPPVTLRRAIIIDLDSASDAAEAWIAGGAAPEIRLRCARLCDHGSTLGDLANSRRNRLLRAHHVVVRTNDVRCDDATRDSLLRLGAAVEIEDVSWPAPETPIDGLAELVRGLVPTHVVMSPGQSLLDTGARERCVDWVTRNYVTGVCLRLGGGEADAAALFGAFQELDSTIGDVVIVNMPSDEVLLGNTDRGWLEGETVDAGLRREYVRWRIPILKDTEGRNTWGQIPAVEDRWVRTAEDLLPNSPGLLSIGLGSRIVDFCGGLGRVARRLSPSVGADGLVISIERRRFMIERARRYAMEGGFTNLQFRVARAERMPMPEGVLDAAVNEWSGGIWELGIGPTMLSEMARLVRPGGRVAVTHRLVQLHLDELHAPWVQYPDIYWWVREAFRRPELAIIVERVWGQVVPSMDGDNASDWRELHLPRLVDPNDYIIAGDDPERGTARADVFLTMIAERLENNGRSG